MPGAYLLELFGEGLVFRDEPITRLLLVPLLLGMVAAGLTAWFNAQQDVRQNNIEDRRAQAERELANQRAQGEARELAEYARLTCERHVQ